MSPRASHRRWTCAFALVLLLLSSCQTSSGRRPEGVRNRAAVEAAARGLQSADWKLRYKALLGLRAFGAAVNDLVLPVLRDRCEVVRKAAQHHFIDLGEAAVPYLAERLVETDRDEGYFATIAGGTERSEIKSLAGTLWLTLVRGTPRDRCFEITRELIASDDPRVRAVGLFTVASMREGRFVRLLEPIAGDPDPMIRERYWVSLILLLTRKGPDLDEATCAQVLEFLEPELVPLLSSDQLGVGGRAQTFGYVLTSVSPHADLKPRFMEMLRHALADDRLSVTGAIRAGAVISRQLEEKDRARVFREWVAGLALMTSDSRTHRQLAALSAFPPSAYDLKALPGLLDLAEELAEEERVPACGLPRLAANFLLRALAEGDRTASRRAMTSLYRWIAHSDPQFSLEAAIAHVRVLAETEKVKKGADAGPEADEEQIAYKQQHGVLVRSAARHADEIFARATSMTHREVNELIRLFLFLGDPRYLDLFKILWSHRWDDDPGINGYTITAVLRLSRRQDLAILPLVLDCAERPEGKWHRSLRDLCVTVLMRNSRYGAFLPEFLTPERLERWVEIIEDPDLYPRTRASFFSILQAKALSAEQRKIFADLALKYTVPPHDSNQRSKAIVALGYSEDRRVLAPLRAIALETDHPWWIYENVVPTLAVLHGAPAAGYWSAPEGPVPKKAVEALVNLLEEQLARMTRHDEVRFAYTNNYYSWGIEYLRYPPDVTMHFLKQYTRQDFGLEIAKWRTWLSSQGDIL